MPADPSVKWHTHADWGRGDVGDSHHGQHTGMAHPMAWFSSPMIVEGSAFQLSTMAPNLQTYAGARRRLNATCASRTGSKTYTGRHGIGLGETELFDASRDPNSVSKTRGPE